MTMNNAGMYVNLTVVLYILIINKRKLKKHTLLSRWCQILDDDVYEPIVVQSHQKKQEKEKEEPRVSRGQFPGFGREIREAVL